MDTDPLSSSLHWRGSCLTCSPGFRVVTSTS